MGMGANERREVAGATLADLMIAVLGVAVGLVVEPVRGESSRVVQVCGFFVPVATYTSLYWTLARFALPVALGLVLALLVRCARFGRLPRTGEWLALATLLLLLDPAVPGATHVVGPVTTRPMTYVETPSGAVRPDPACASGGADRRRSGGARRARAGQYGGAWAGGLWLGMGCVAAREARTGALDCSAARGGDRLGVASGAGPAECDRGGPVPLLLARLYTGPVSQRPLRRGARLVRRSPVRAGALAGRAVCGGSLQCWPPAAWRAPGASADSIQVASVCSGPNGPRRPWRACWPPPGRGMSWCCGRSPRLRSGRRSSSAGSPPWALRRGSGRAGSSGHRPCEEGGLGHLVDGDRGRGSSTTAYVLRAALDALRIEPECCRVADDGRFTLDFTSGVSRLGRSSDPAPPSGDLFLSARRAYWPGRPAGWPPGLPGEPRRRRVRDLHSGRIRTAGSPGDAPGGGAGYRRLEIVILDGRAASQPLAG